MDNTADLATWLDNNGGARGTDICSPFEWQDIFINSVEGCAGTGSLTYAFKIIDECGNERTTNATFIIQDTQPPTVNCEPDDKIYECSSDNSAVASAWNNDNINKLIACSSDECGNFTVTSDFIYNIPSEPCGFTGSIDVEYTIMDECGLMVKKFATFTVKDDTPPVAVCQDITVQLDSDGLASITPDQIDNGSSDICGNCNFGKR